MTDRINALIVVLEMDIRDDDLDATRKAIEQIKGVVSVENNVADISDSVARSRMRAEMTQHLYDLIKKINQ
jgi:hypothetical protein